ncbi:uncharacterized protein RCC_05886 [Ramularia collo-cygni]|uniref:Uncharacterized protein n=1 Tax=Ramularia collo-cygni TaxID=112498 RepID=A0A2D3VE80_9PEZI|nr:uncharacterized protein RCC_05886 [Ramularia collo-cygni]CZT20029.1 uncharacterized protein RCC_05886 [Ramularia collo-cygni]
MATPPEQPWTNRERNYLLAEIIKAADPPAENLFNLIRVLNVQPRWEDIPLPTGRSLNSSRNAFEDLWRSMSSQSMVAPHTPTPLSMPAQPIKRPYPFDGMYSTGSSARAIRPRPAQSITTYPQTTNEPPAKKKRGRPTKAEQAAKEEAKLAAVAAAATASGESASAPISRLATQTPAPTQVPTTMTTHSEEVKPLMPAAARMPIAAMLTPTAHEPKSASNSGGSSSSGKRRRARSNRLEAEGGGNMYGPSHGRMDPEPDDSPARTAVLRHREESSTDAPRIDSRDLSGEADNYPRNPSPH